MIITAKFASACTSCHQPVSIGDRVDWTKGVRGVKHATCGNSHSVSARASAPRVRRGHDHEDCLSMGPCGPYCDYADLLGGR